jgi:putative NADPH-quinone reductase
VVLSHPVKNSLCHYFGDTAIAHLKSKGYDITLLDLYHRGFSPTLTQAERQSYYENPFNDALIAEEVSQLTQTESLVLVFPTWWFGFPAILKGWFDRVWAPGHAYNHAPNFGPMIPNLHHLKEVKVITTLGAPWWVDTLVLWKPIHRILKIAIIGTCTKGCKFQMLSFYKSEAASTSRVEAFVKKIKAKF